MEELKPCYQRLIDKCIPGHLKWSTDTGAHIACMCARVYGASPRDVRGISFPLHVKLLDWGDTT